MELKKTRITGGLLRLVAEVPLIGEHHGDPRLVACLDDLTVLDAASTAKHNRHPVLLPVLRLEAISSSDMAVLLKQKRVPQNMHHRDVTILPVTVTKMLFAFSDTEKCFLSK